MSIQGQIYRTAKIVVNGGVPRAPFFATINGVKRTISQVTRGDGETRSLTVEDGTWESLLHNGTIEIVGNHL